MEDITKYISSIYEADLWREVQALGLMPFLELSFISSHINKLTNVTPTPTNWKIKKVSKDAVKYPLVFTILTGSACARDCVAQIGAEDEMGPGIGDTLCTINKQTASSEAPCV